MIGGGSGSFIGIAHRIASYITEDFQLMGGVFNADPEIGLKFAMQLQLDRDRIYGGIDEFIFGEMALPKDERMEVVAVATPNYLHYDMVKKLVLAGFHIICEKPVTTSSKEAVELERLINENNVVFCLTHNYTGYPMVRQMRKMIEDDVIGKVHKVDAQYYQGWINPFIHEKEKRADIWRLNPDIAGISCCIGDIGVHAFNLIEYVTQLQVSEVLGDLNNLYEDVPLDVDGSILLRLNENIKGVITASQIATGEENSIQVKVYGRKGGLKWDQEDPNVLYLLQNNKPAQVYRSANEYNDELSNNGTNIAPGHPEGFFEAFANLYKGVAKAIRGERTLNGEFPTISDGIRGVQFIEAVVKSNRQDNIWVDL